MAKFIVAAPPIAGEVGPLLHIARTLAARGHQITFLSGSLFREAAENAGLAFAALTGDADYDVRDIITARDRSGVAPGTPDELNFGWIHAFVDSMPQQHRDLQKLLEREPDQYLISNVLFLGALPVRRRAPGRRPLGWTAVSVVGLAISSDDSTFFGPVPVGPGEDAKAANRAGNAAFHTATAPTRDRMNELLRETGATETDESFIDCVYTAADATAVLSVPGFEFHRDDLPAGLHLVGALPVEPVAGWEPPAWWSELDGSRPVVVVTQGTLANHDLSQLVEPALAALAELDVTVVAAVGRADPAATSIAAPANAHVAGFIPFGELLPKADLLITNGGAGGLHSALAAGLPVIVAGATEDKPANAARVAYHRLGLNLGTATPTAEAIRAATTQALTDTEIRDNVAQLAKVYAGHDPVSEIERLTLT